jgi:hypothetical protein
MAMKKEDEIQPNNTNAEPYAATMAGLPIEPIPLRVTKVSGLFALNALRSGFDPSYEDSETAAMPDAIPIPIPIQREELRIDVDGSFPQMMASGFVQINLAANIHWIAKLKPAGTLTWAGGIWYKNGVTASFPYTEIKVVVSKPSPFLPPQQATLTLAGPGIRPRTRILQYVSPYFHRAEFEYDWEKGITPSREINTWDHPNHPASIPNERLSIENVYRRAGIDVTLSPNGNEIAGAPGAYWSDMEMHDAMQIYWSHFANKSQWALWVLFAGLHEGNVPSVPDPGLGGIMFDDIGPNERQGTALFLKSFISQPPAGDPNPAAWVNRMRFWTAVHEIGHTFNLAHSWQKSLVSGGHGPWIPLTNDSEARSFMNYPYRVSGGETAFFNNFEYRFINPELLFLRHAPSRFVQMGNAEWFDNHGFRQANTTACPTFRLEVRANRAKMTYDYLEPITLELKLTNISQQPQLISSDLISKMENLTVVTKQGNLPARQYTPLAVYCTNPEIRALAPNESIYDSLFISADRNGWGLAEPGNYRMQAVLHFPNEDIVSAPLTLRIAMPHSRTEEVIAQDYFSTEVGRVLTFDGSQFLENANDTLRELSEKLPDTRAARHALVALGNPLTRKYKTLNIKETGTGGQRQIEVVAHKIDTAVARKNLNKALTENMELSAESLGHIDYKYYMDQFADWLALQGDKQQAAKLQNDLHKVMAARGVIARVLDEIKATASEYGTQKESRARA